MSAATAKPPGRRACSAENRAHTSSAGAFYDVARTLIEREAAVLVTPAPNYIAIATRWVEALLDAFAGRADTEEALVAAAADIDALT